MPYFSSVVGKPVVDVDGERVGRLEDLIAAIQVEIHHPEVQAIVVNRSKALVFLPISEISALVAPAIPLARRLDEIAPYQPTDRDLFLARDVLDKQMIDINDARVVRVNDIELTWVKGRFYIANVEIGGISLLRRMGLVWLAKRLARRNNKGSGSSISWGNLELLPGTRKLRLKVPSSKINELHPADLAEIISDLSHLESMTLLDTLDAKKVADTLEAVEPDFQASLVKTMADEKVADVLDEMAPDAAADLLAELPEERTQELLNLMEHKEAEDVRKLLAFPEDTAGGIMTTDFIAVRSDLSAGQALSIIRKKADEVETIYNVYVTDSEGRLVGIFTLRDLILARPETPVSEFMNLRFPSVHLRDSQDELAKIVAKYNLMAVAVVGDLGKLQGIVTADDALDKIIPTTWKKRLPKLYH